VCAIAVGSFAIYVLTQDHPTDQPCPDGFRSMPAAGVYLHPTILQYENWVGLPAADLGDDYTWVYACTDGFAIGRMKRDRVEFDSSTGLAEVKVPTRWVDLLWAQGDLTSYQNPNRWTLVYLPAD
jgi:hypothetical protein